MTTRDQIALDIYLRFATDCERLSPFEDDAKIAYQATDIFLEEMKRQAPEPEAPAPLAPMPTPTQDERPTVTPEVGKRYYMRNGEVAHITKRHLDGSYSSPREGGGHNIHRPDGRAWSNLTQYDLVDECPF